MQGQYFVVVVAFSSMSRSAMWNKSHKTGSFIFQMIADRKFYISDDCKSPPRYSSDKDSNETTIAI